jgi:hypothetical protein
MSVQLSEFQRVNGGNDDLLPLYIQKNQEPKIISKGTIFLYSLCMMTFLLTGICIKNFINNTTIIYSQLRNDDLYYTPLKI